MKTKKRFKNFKMSMLMVLFMGSMQQLFAAVIVTSASGTTSYTLFIDALNAINGGSHTGTITVKVPAGFSETGPSNLNFQLTASGTAANPIKFIKDPATSGADPILIANTEYTPGSFKEAIFSILGGDYITISGFDLRENDLNIDIRPTQNLVTEFGIAVFTAGATDGAKNNQISDNKITLREGYQNAVGIFSSSKSTSIGGPVVVTTNAGTNSFNKFYNNTITKVAFGIYTICPQLTATMSETNDIGSTTSGTGNTITFGNDNPTEVMSATWTDFDNTKKAGIILVAGVASKIINNTVTTQIGLTKSSTGILICGLAASGLSYISTIDNNTITMNSTGVNLTMTGIDFGLRIVVGTMNANNNTISITQTASGPSDVTGIKANYLSEYSNLTGNTITIDQTAKDFALNSIVLGINAAGKSNYALVKSNTITIQQHTFGLGSYTASSISYINVTAPSINVLVELNSFNASSTYPILNSGTLICVQQDGNVTGTVEIKNNTANIYRTAGGGSIYFSRTLATATEYIDVISGNSITFSGLALGTSVFGISCIGGSTTLPSLNKNIHHNTISFSGTNTGTSVGIACGKTNTGEIKSNSITINTASAVVNGIDIFSAFSGTIGSNTIDLTSSSVAPTAMAGIRAAFGGPFTIESNSISQMNLSGVFASAPSVNAIGVLTGTGNKVYKNTISNMSVGSSTTIGAGNAILNGIIVDNGTSTEVYQNKIYGLTAYTSGAGTVVNGINSTGTVTNPTNTIYNNMIGSLSAPKASADNLVRGISITSTRVSTHNVYFNTIYLSATTSSAFSGSSGVYHIANAAIDNNVLNLRNNIINNNSTSAGSGKTVAFRRSGVTLANFASTSNNNVFYSNALFYTDGVNISPNMSAYKGWVAPKEFQSDDELVTFLSISGSSANFLHVNNTLPTKVESKAYTISPISDDFDGEIRQGISGYAGTGTAQDIGADEGEFISFSKPVITFTPSFPSCIDGNNRVFSNVVITDADGVSLTSDLPRLYYRIAPSGAWYYAEGVPNTGSTTTFSIWSFTLDVSVLDRLIPGKVVEYYFEAQDMSSPGHIYGTWPLAGRAAPDYYVVNGLAGEYTVGTAGAYTTITNAVNDYNTRCITAAVVFSLIDVNYSTSEFFPITINSNAYASAIKTLTIQPASGVSSTIKSVSNSGIFKFYGADYVTINGSNAPVSNSICPSVSSSRNLTLYSDHAVSGITESVVLLVPASASNGSNYNAVKNCIIKGSDITGYTFAGINIGGTNLIITPIATNNYNLFENNSISHCSVAICSKGLSAVNKNSHNSILQNQITGHTIGRFGIHTGFEDNMQISGNILDFYGQIAIAAIVAGGSETYPMTKGEYRGDELTNSTISYNKISNVRFHAVALGIYLGEASSGTNLISNNMLNNIVCKGDLLLTNIAAGISIGGGSGSVTKVYNNTVNMNEEVGEVYTGYHESYALVVSATTAPTIDLRNNILSNVGNAALSSGINSYAIGLNYSSTAGAYAGLTSDNNDLYVPTDTYHFIAKTGGLSSGSSIISLSDWQTETGTDASSKNVEPAFLTLTDSHLSIIATTSAILNGAGAVLTEVTNDIDCDPRDASTPDIGADEFTPPAAFILASVSELDNTQSHSVYPNPATQNLTVQLRNNDADAYWTLTNSIGQKVQESLLKSGVELTKMDLSKLKEGIYFYQIQSGDKTYSGKIVKL